MCQLRSKKVRGSGVMRIATVMHANTLLGSGAPRDFGLYSYCSVVFVQCSIVPACGCRLGRRRPPGTKVCSGKGVSGVSPKQQEWLDASLETSNAWEHQSRRSAPWEQRKDQRSGYGREHSPDRQRSGYGRGEKRSSSRTVAPAVPAVAPAVPAEQRSFVPVKLRHKEPNLELEVFIQLLTLFHFGQTISKQYLIIYISYSFID